MTGKVKYFLFFLLVTASAYGLSTLLLSYLDHELANDLSFSPPGKPSIEKKLPPPLSPAEYPKPTEKRAASLERKEDISKRTSGPQDKPGLTSLNLTLLGTVVNESGLSWAVIKDLATGRQEMVSVGSVVAGAMVVSIGKDRVVLNVNGREEILLLGVEGTRSASAGGDQGAQESATSTYVLSREVVRENLENLPGLMTQARAELYYKEGRPEGFQLSQIQQGSPLRSIGFENGDVIRSVNGQEVRSLEDAIALYQKLGDDDSFVIGILRGEKPKYLHVKIK